MLVDMLLAPPTLFWADFSQHKNRFEPYKLSVGRGLIVLGGRIRVMDNLSEMLVGKQRPEGNGPTGGQN